MEHIQITGHAVAEAIAIERKKAAAEIERLQSELESLRISANHECAARQKAERKIESMRAWQREARAWLGACLGFVTGEGPPSWDGIRAFLATDEQTASGNTE